MLNMQLNHQHDYCGPRTDWREDAACQSADPELFFPVSSTGPSRDQAERAKAVCAVCPVRRECLQFALATQQAHGVWGGMSEHERRHEPRHAKLTPTAPPLPKAS
jgi:WhiB family transcriptional regulator, redox-sensing transcriptional regulator